MAQPEVGSTKTVNGRTYEYDIELGWIQTDGPREPRKPIRFFGDRPTNDRPKYPSTEGQKPGEIGEERNIDGTTFYYDADAGWIPKGGVGSAGSGASGSQTSSGNVVRIGDREYDMSNPDDVEDLEEFQEAEAQRQPPMADIRGGGGVKSDGTRLAPPAAPASAGPQPATVSLPLLDLDGINNHLDTILVSGPKGSDGNPIWEYNGNTQLAELGGTPTETVVEGEAATPTQENSDADTADNNRAVPIPGEPGAPNYGPNGNDPSRRAFLDHPGGSMAATRAALAARGLYSQGGKYFTNIDGEAVEISRNDYNGLRLGNIDAQTFKDNYQANLQSDLEPAEAPATAGASGQVVEGEVEIDDETGDPPASAQSTPGSVGVSASIGDDDDDEE